MIKIHGMCPDKLIPDEMLEQCKVAIKDSKQHYFLASKLDQKNEIRPKKSPNF